MTRLSHVDEEGRARMVDVSDKAPTHRAATARGAIICKVETLEQVRRHTTRVGDQSPAGRNDGHPKARAESPLCHPLPLTHAAVSISSTTSCGFEVSAEVRTHASTGVEMEALTAVSVACLTLFDMLKAIDRSMIIEGIQVVSKSGGRSADWAADA
jgi:cyclic pyranopterin phosphate synthase